jgi:predicted nucleotidyltransferase
MTQVPYKDIMIKIIEIFFPDAKIYLFGSYARGDNRAGSDIDIAIDVGRKLTLDELSMIKSLISALPMAQKVDVVCMHRIPEKMKDIILRDGKLWKPLELKKNEEILSQ